MGSRSHKIWIDTNSGSGKPFGCGQDDEIVLPISIGVSASNTRHLSTVRISCWEDEKTGEISFCMGIDGQTYRTGTYNRKKKEFGKIKGRKVNGNPMIMEKREKKSAMGMLKMVSTMAAMGEIFADTQKEKNDWKLRMMKAGLPQHALHVPEDWDQLSEDEKTKRLDGAIKILGEEPKEDLDTLEAKLKTEIKKLK